MGKFAEYLEKCERYSYVTANLAACILIPKKNVTSFYIYSVTANLAALILIPKRNVTLFYIYSVTANLAALILIPSELDIVWMEKFRDFWRGLQIPNL